ncbi:MAG: bestrophin family protein [Crocinitomicaceae bacterium]|jgi:putative membrane protein
MISYNPKSWFTLIFSFSKSDTVRMLWKQLIYIGVLSLAITFAELHFFPKAAFLKNLIAVYSLLGFVISLLLVFRTNTAYDRWWEGRKIWGAIVNDSRNLALKINAIESIKNEKAFFKNTISNFCFSSKNHLRDQTNEGELEFNEFNEREQYILADHKPIFFVNLLQSKLYQLKSKGQISDNEWLILDKNVNALVDSIGGCERIKNTPIPYSYSLFIKKFIFIYVITLPLAFVNQFSYFSAFIATFVFYALVSMEVLAEEIEDPFGEDDNDLPTDQICERIKQNVSEILN